MSPAEAFLHERLDAVLGRKGLGIWLDAGCGDGDFIDELLAGSHARELWAFDPDEDALSRLRSWFLKQGPDIPLYHFCASSPEPALPRGNFDSISFQDMLHHLKGGCFGPSPDPALISAVLAHLDSMDALLAPGGLMIISEFVVDSDMPPARSARLAMHELKARVDWMQGIPHSSSFNSDTLEDLLGSWAASRGYSVEGSSVLPTQLNPVLAGRADGILESSLDDFEAMIRGLSRSGTDAPDAPDAPDAVSALLGRFEQIRREAMTHGLLAQKRLILFLKKPESGSGTPEGYARSGGSGIEPPNWSHGTAGGDSDG